MKLYLIDMNSTLPFYDEAGNPKKYAPTRLDPARGWLYALNPRRGTGPLKGEALAAHLEEIQLTWAKRSTNGA